jgi:phage tail tape-measure protein
VETVTKLKPPLEVAEEGSVVCVQESVGAIVGVTVDGENETEGVRVGVAVGAVVGERVGGSLCAEIPITEQESKR